jgi:D-alanine-D-alanine ligase
MKKGARLGVIIGGPSSEYEVSKATAESIFSVSHNLDLNFLPILVTRDGSWYVYASPMAYKNKQHHQTFTTSEAIERLPEVIDAALIAMHGSFGEDGSLQRLLDRAGLPYQGSGVRASRLAFNKHAASQILRRSGFAVPEHTLIKRAQWVVSRSKIIRQVAAAYGLPLVVKPNTSGSSVGVSIPTNVSDLAEAMELTSAEYDEVLVQRYMRGSEVTCGVLQRGDEMLALPPTLIRPRKSTFFDYNAKYTVDATEEITPAPFSPVTIRAIGQTALGVHRALKLQGYSRVDMIIASHRLWVLEANTLPGLTATSLFPQAAAAQGIDFTNLVVELANHALTRPEVVELS